ncbi:MAG TPA: hypothetical protein VF523_09245 [Burkholderiales bacterium]
MKWKILGLAAFSAAVMLAAAPGRAAEADTKYTGEEFKSDVKAAGKGIKDAAVEVGHQVATGTKKAYKSAKNKIKKDIKDRKPGDGSLAKKNDSLPAVSDGRKSD